MTNMNKSCVNASDLFVWFLDNKKVSGFFVLATMKKATKTFKKVGKGAKATKKVKNLAVTSFREPQLKDNSMTLKPIYWRSGSKEYWTESSEVSGPYSVTHEVGVDKNLEWRGTDPLSVFSITEKLGEG